MTTSMTAPRVGVVLLTQGTRPAELREALQSVLAQQGVELDVVVVGNGWIPRGLPDGVRGLALGENLGIPAGRNRGAEAVSGEWIFFLDDDAAVPSTTFVRDAVELMIDEPAIALVQPQVLDPSGVTNPQRWIPRMRKGDPSESSDVFSVWEGAVVMDRAVFDQIGGWGDPYFYAHEGIELAWRVWAAGRRARYEGGLVAHHPAIDPARHSYYHRLNARNRVWLAKRNLPRVLIPFYVGTWTIVHIVRNWRSPLILRSWFRGWFEGWRTSPGGEQPMGWRTVWRMTRAGRPPIV